MKKILCTLLAFAASFSLLMAQEETFPVHGDTIEPTRQGYHPYDTVQNVNIAPQSANWSITPHIGFNSFDGDFNKSETKHTIGFPSVGLDVEYAFTPVFGIGVEYMFNRYGVAGKNGHASVLLKGYMHRPSAYLSVDLIGLFYPRDKRKIVGLDLIGGGGYAFYKTKAMFYDNKHETAAGIKDPTHTKGNTLKYVNADGKVGEPDYMNSYEGGGFLMGGLNLEFNLNRSLALGVRAMYNYFMTDKIDGRGYAGDAGVASKNNDGMFDVTLNLRIKLSGKEHSHMRNMNGNESDPVMAQRLQDPESFFVHDTTIIIYRDTVIIREEAAEAPTATSTHTAASAPSQYYYIYFATNKTTLDDEGLITVQQIADRMEEDTTLYAIIEGYCDNTGNNQVNYRIGDQRAQSVLTELRDEHEVPADHLYAGGIGKLVGKRNTAAYGPNRRAVVRLVDKETFDLLRGTLDDKKEQREPAANAPTVTVPLSVSRAVTAKNDEFKNRNNEKVRSDRNTTLSGLARKYYSNTHCWVYLYAANRDRIASPNNIKTGTILVIPELTQEELAITKEQCLSLYRQAQRRR